MTYAGEHRMNQPRVSVVVAAYNAARTLEACITSIQNQGLQDLEIIVADDCSTDDTAELAARLAATDPRVIVVRCARNGGPAAARNAALDRATGEWIAVVDSDDTILPSRFATLIAAGDMHHADIVFDDLVYITAGDQDNSRRYLGDAFAGMDASMETYVQSHRRTEPMPNMGFLKPMIRRATLGDQRYDTTLKIGEDAMLVLQLMARGAKACLVPEALYCYHRHAGSISAKQDAASIRAINAAYRGFVADDAASMSDESKRLLTLLIADNDARIAAKDLADEVGRFQLVRVATRLLARPALAKPMAREVASRFKQALRRS